MLVYLSFTYSNNYHFAFASLKSVFSYLHLWDARLTVPALYPFGRYFFAALFSCIYISQCYKLTLPWMGLKSAPSGLHHLFECRMFRYRLLVIRWHKERILLLGEGQFWRARRCPAQIFSDTLPVIVRVLSTNGKCVSMAVLKNFIISPPNHFNQFCLEKIVCFVHSSLL